MEPTQVDARSDRPALEGAHVLVVEDDFFILADLQSGLADAGAEIVGPFRNAKEALAALDGQDITAAILDLQLGAGRSSVPVGRELARRGIPFLFYTGQLDTKPIRAEWPDCKVISKPAPLGIIMRAIAQLLGG
jgi:DNA-binding response OmpR family regulator